MTTDDIYDLLAEAINEIIPEAWTMARLNVQYLVSGHETEFEGVYLTPSGEVVPLPSAFPIEAIEAIQALYAVRQNDGQPNWNHLHIDLSAKGDFDISFTWNQEIQDEDDHFMKGGTVAAWAKIRAEKYGNG
ncbi:MAG: hypothetical protein H7Z72_08630 [Bacteroidetes bacterium]|nr:hypothetical protein [Fibrella sp.]